MPAALDGDGVVKVVTVDASAASAGLRVVVDDDRTDKVLRECNGANNVAEWFGRTCS